jgi:hypothetical protein
MELATIADLAGQISEDAIPHNDSFIISNLIHNLINSTVSLQQVHKTATCRE